MNGPDQFLNQSGLTLSRRFRRGEGVHQHQQVLVGISNHVQQRGQVLLVGQVAGLSLEFKSLERRSRQGGEIRAGAGWRQEAASFRGHLARAGHRGIKKQALAGDLIEK